MSAFGCKTRFARLLVVIAIGALAGCDYTARLDEDLAQARQVKDPYVASTLMATAYKDYYIHGCLWRGCTQSEIESARNLDKAGGELMVNAVKAGDLRAIDAVFNTFSSSLVKEEAAPSVIELAEKPNASARVLVIAGNLVMQGEYIPAEFRQAFGYFSRAWQQGDPASAEGLMALFTRQGDAANSYLWQLRCAGQCQWEDEELLATIPPERKLEIERAVSGNLLMVETIPLTLSTLEN